MYVQITVIITLWFAYTCTAAKLSNVLSFSSVLPFSLLFFFLERILSFIRQEVLGLSVLRWELRKWSQGSAEPEVGCC